MLTGFLLFALDTQNKDHPIFKEFKELAKAKTAMVKQNRAVKLALYRTIRKLQYFRMQETRQSILDRKADARKKIILGGLFLKADFASQL